MSRISPERIGRSSKTLAGGEAKSIGTSRVGLREREITTGNR